MGGIEERKGGTYIPQRRWEACVARPGKQRFKNSLTIFFFKSPLLLSRILPNQVHGAYIQRMRREDETHARGTSMWTTVVIRVSRFVYYVWAAFLPTWGCIMTFKLFSFHQRPLTFWLWPGWLESGSDAPRLHGLVIRFQ